MSVERALVPDRGIRRGPTGRGAERTRLRSVPVSSRSPRGPFVVLVLVILGIGLIGLLILNTSLQQGSFVLQELQSQTAALRDKQTTLADDVAARGAPGALAREALTLGMVKAQAPLFLELPTDPAGSGSAGSGGAR